MIRNWAADGNQKLSKDLPFPTPNPDQATLKSVLHQVGPALSQLSSSVLVNSSHTVSESLVSERFIDSQNTHSLVVAKDYVIGLISSTSNLLFSC